MEVFLEDYDVAEHLDVQFEWNFEAVEVLEAVAEAGRFVYWGKLCL